MTEKNKTIYDLFEVEPVKKEMTLVETYRVDETTEDKSLQDAFDADFEEARRNMLYIIDSAKSALEDVHVIAKEKEGAKEYDSFNNLLKTVGDASNVLLKLHADRKKFKQKAVQKEEIKNGIAVNNAVFVGSSSDFKKMLDK